MAFPVKDSLNFYNQQNVFWRFILLPMRWGRVFTEKDSHIQVFEQVSSSRFVYLANLLQKWFKSNIEIPSNSLMFDDWRRVNQFIVSQENNATKELMYQQINLIEE